MSQSEKAIQAIMQCLGTGRLAEAEKFSRQVLKIEPGNAGALHALGLSFYLRRNYPEAIIHIQKAVEVEGRNAQFLCNLAECHRRCGAPEKALPLFEKSLLVQPDFLKAHLGMGNALRDLKRFEEAVARFRLALAISPDFAEAYHYLGVAFMEVNRLEEALPMLRKAVALRPGYSDAEMSLANALEQTGRTDEAVEVYEAMLKTQPDAIAVHNNLGNILKNMGRMDDAVEHYRKALKLDPAHAPAIYNLSRTQKGDAEGNREAMEAMLETPGISPEQQVNLHFALGKIYDDLGEYGKSFVHFKQGNIKDARGEPFDAERHTAAVDRLLTVFNRKFFEERRGLGSESERPVFIVGMPRSGTTLVEQVLASHPKVFGAGELDHIGHLLTDVSRAPVRSGAGYPEVVGQLDAMAAVRLGEDYISRWPPEAKGHARVTDKMPGNFMHLGFIALILPRARIIHCRRDPLDVCLSCYFQHFTSIMPFSRTLEDLGAYYRDYERVMEHWRAILPLEILDVPYEEMVGDTETTSRRLIDFAGLEWDKACLEYYKTDRQVKTASSWQVRQPIYTRSLKRWKNYNKEIDPLVQALGLEMKKGKPKKKKDNS